jgi:excisionase family DNA binding protein
MITVAEIANRLCVSERSVCRWIDVDTLKVHRLGRARRISEADFESFLASALRFRRARRNVKKFYQYQR